jgi:polyhydroxybutyrate depolymerase
MNINRLFLILILGFLLQDNSSLCQTTGSFLFDGINRTYTLYVPASWTPEKHFPLLLSLHGYTQNGNEMMTFSGFNTYADEYGFIVVYPDGVSASWNVGFAGGSTADDVGFLSALIDTLNTHYSVDLNRVYSTGFSNGGFMSYRLACELGNRIAAIASVSGTMTDGSLSSCQPHRNIPVMHIHGTSDMVVSYNGGFGNASVDELLSFWRSYNLCPATPTIVNLPDSMQEGSTVQKQTWTPCNDSTEVVLYKINGGGHSWPGSIGTTGLGNTNRDIIASDEIWKFFSRFQLPQNTTQLPEFMSEALNVYPNPASTEIITMEMKPVMEYTQLEISTLEGKFLLHKKLSPGTSLFAVDIHDLIPGVYLLKLSSSEYSGYQKLVVRK